MAVATWELPRPWNMCAVSDSKTEGHSNDISFSTTSDPGFAAGYADRCGSRQEEESSYYSLSKQEKTEPGIICLPPAVTNLCDWEKHHWAENCCEEAHGESLHCPVRVAMPP